MFRVWKGIFRIRDLTTVRESGKRQVSLRDPRFYCSGFDLTRQNLGMGCRTFSAGNSENRHHPNKLSSGQSHCCLLSNQAIECAWLSNSYLIDCMLDCLRWLIPSVSSRVHIFRNLDEIFSTTFLLHGPRYRK